MRKAVIILFLILVAIGLFRIIYIFTLPNMERGVVYKNHEYRFLPSGRYSYDLSRSELKGKKAVGRLDDAIIYTLWDDPDDFYLYPKASWLHLGYNVLCRQDFYPLQGDGEIDYMVLKYSNGRGKGNSSFREWRLDKEKQANIIAAFQNENAILTSTWEEKENNEAYLLDIFFSRPVGLKYRTRVVKYGENYGLLLDDDQTLVKISDLECQGDS